MPSFLDLPPELRNNVYKEVLALDERHHSSTKPDFCDESLDYFRAFKNIKHANDPKNFFRALSQVSRQIRLETISMFYGSKTFNIVIKFCEMTEPTRKPAYYFVRTDVHVARWSHAASDAALSSIRKIKLIFACPWPDYLAMMHRSKVVGKGDWGQHVESNACGVPSGFGLLIDLTEGTVCNAEGPRVGNCETCKSLVQAWLNGISTIDGRRQITKEQLLALAW